MALVQNYNSPRLPPAVPGVRTMSTSSAGNPAESSGSRLAQIQARFQHRQMQEKEQRLIQMLEERQQQTIQRVNNRSSATSLTSLTSVGSPNSSLGSGGKVRQMFEERRQNAVPAVGQQTLYNKNPRMQSTSKGSPYGWDKSYPLEPVETKQSQGSRTMSSRSDPSGDRYKERNGYGASNKNRGVSLDRFNGINRNNMRRAKSQVQMNQSSSEDGSSLSPSKKHGQSRNLRQSQTHMGQRHKSMGSLIDSNQNKVNSMAWDTVPNSHPSLASLPPPRRTSIKSGYPNRTRDTTPPPVYQKKRPNNLSVSYRNHMGQSPDMTPESSPTKPRRNDTFNYSNNKSNINETSPPSRSPTTHTNDTIDSSQNSALEDTVNNNNSKKISQIRLEASKMTSKEREEERRRMQAEMRRREQELLSKIKEQQVEIERMKQQRTREEKPKPKAKPAPLKRRGPLRTASTVSGSESTTEELPESDDSKSTTSETQPVKKTPPARPPKPARRPLMASKARDDLVACTFCGRRFNEDRVSKHESICRKSTQKKRKMFDPIKMRTQGTEAEQFVNTRAPKNEPTQKSTGNWRKQHESFLQAIREARKVQKHLAAGGALADLPPPPPMDTSDYKQCPYCNRKFNESVAERHIPKCKNIQSNKR